jgi:hypothetical protein
MFVRASFDAPIERAGAARIIDVWAIVRREFRIRDMIMSRSAGI